MINKFSEREQRLLAHIQTGFPLENRPFLTIAGQVGSSESEVIGDIQSLVQSRAIRELGPVFDARRLGYVSTLIAARVEHDRTAELAAAMLAVNEITHNYYREGEYNIWFTVTARDRNALDEIVRWVEKFPGVARILDLPVERMIKLNAIFGSAEAPTSAARTVPALPLTEGDYEIIRVLQRGLPVVEQPFLAMAGEAGMSEESLITRIRRWLEEGVMRRFGARVNHHRMGYSVNALAAWEGEDVHEWGNAFAELPRISHCYLRRSYPDWPYRLYTMIHAMSESELNETLSLMRRIAPGARSIVMKTLYELKKTSMKYFLES